MTDQLTQNQVNQAAWTACDTFRGADVAALQKEINRLEDELVEVRGRMAGYLKELGVHVER